MLFKKIAIIGVGLIGGSIGLGVKKRGVCERVIGIGRRASSLKKALGRGAVDEITTSKSKVKDADLIIPATPVRSIPLIIREILPFVKKGAIISDVGSTKQQIVSEVEKMIPDEVHFVGGHPLAGSEKKGVEFADSNLFENSICFLTPLEKERNREAVKQLIRFWRALGAEPIVISPEEHDFVVGGISHLTHIVAVALVSAVLPMKLKGRRLVEFAGQGWKDTTRIAHSPSDVWINIISTNRDKILEFMEKFQTECDKIKSLLEKKEWKKLEKILKKVANYENRGDYEGKGEICN